MKKLFWGHLMILAIVAKRKPIYFVAATQRTLHQLFSVKVVYCYRVSSFKGGSFSTIKKELLL